MKRFRFLPKLPRLIIGFAFCCSLLLLLRGFTHSNDLAFLYDLPKKDMVLHLEESISSSVSTSMDPPSPPINGDCPGSLPWVPCIWTKRRFAPSPQPPCSEM